MLKIDTKRGIFSLPLYLILQEKNETIGQRRREGYAYIKDLTSRSHSPQTNMQSENTSMPAKDVGQSYAL